jgi:hypothetical protein
MTLLQKIKAILGITDIREDILTNVSEQLQLQIGFNNIRESITSTLEKIAANKNEPSNFVLLGQQGLGKTIVARDLITNYLFAIKRISKQEFLKVEPYKLSKTNFAAELSLKFIEGRGCLIFIDEVHNLREIEGVFFNSLSEVIKSDDYKETSFAISAGGKSWQSLTGKYPLLKSHFQHEIYFRAYKDEELVEILKEIISKDGLITWPYDEDLIDIISQMREIRNKQGQLFENASEIVFYYYKCLKRAADYLKKHEIDEELISLSLKYFGTKVIRR